MDKLLTVAECAERHQISETAIYDAINRGDIQFIPVGSGYVITEGACLAYQAKKDPAERGRMGALKRWGNKEPTEQKPKRPRGRPKKNQDSYCYI